VQLILGWEVGGYRTIVTWSEQIRSPIRLLEIVMGHPSTKTSAPLPSREERIEALMQQLRPKVEEVVRKMVERAVDVPEAEEFGAIDLEFRDAGSGIATEVRQASLASRKKRGTSGAV
jgi:hypothetical protein